jgi:hypothetical protein
MDNMTKHRNMMWLVTVVAVAALAVIPAAGAGAKSSAGLTNFHGTVVSASTSTNTLRIKRPSGTTLTFRVTGATSFERLGGGLGALKAGRSIEVKASKAGGEWTARKVEPAALEHAAGDDNGGARGGHGADDPAGHHGGGHG